MSEDREVYQGSAGHHMLYGDIFPSNAAYSDPTSPDHILKLYYRNEFIQLMIDWMTAEAFRNWIVLIEDEKPIDGIKFKLPYKFEGYEYTDKETGKVTTITPFQEFLQWNDVPANWKQGVAWSRLYNEGSLLVFLDDSDGLLTVATKNKENTEWEWKANPDPQGYQKFKVYQPKAIGKPTGFEPYSGEGGVAPDGTILKWKLVIYTKYMKQSKTFIIDAGRCLHLLWKKRENGWKASSRIWGMFSVCKSEEQTFQKLTKRAHDLAGGILTVTGVASQDEADDLSSDLGDDLTSVDRLFLKEGRVVAYATPDLKASGEFASIFEMYTKKLCRHMRISQLVLDGEHTGASLGGNDNAETMNSYTEIYEIQEHYRNYLEKVFYKLGKENTNFLYREILPEDLRVDQMNQEAQFNHENEIIANAPQSTDGDDQRKPQSASDSTKTNSGESTR